MDDSVLLGRFVESGCQESFEAIVTRHSGWVFSLSLRAVRDRHLAEDVTQAVFIILARKAGTIRAGTPLSAWLFKVSRFAAKDALKRRTRMQNRENRFAEFFRATAGPDMASPEEALSDQVSGTLDEAVACLSEADRQAIVLRFYEGKSLAEVGQGMGTTEEAAKKRVARAVKKLRGHFERRGLVIPLALLMLLLAGRSHAAGAIPQIVAPAAAPAIAHSIAEGALRLMTHAQAKLLGAIFAGGLALLLGLVSLLQPARPAPPAPVAVNQPPAPPSIVIPLATTQPAPPATQPAPRFADMWIGYKGQLLWRSDTYADPDPVPFVLKSGPRFERPYAVAVDPTGNYYIRPLDQAILEYPAVRLGQTDYDQGPVAAHDRVSTMLSLIDDAPTGFSILPDAARGLIEEQNWHKLRRSADEGGAVVVEPPSPMRFSPLNFGGGEGSLTQSIAVPEPMLLGFIALVPLLLRRRRVAKNRDIP
jgi:RNA polymerase sigma factor (sigma-70 family)